MSKTASLLEKLVAALEQQTTCLERIANHLAPDPGDIVGTPYVAQQLGCTTAWVTDLIKQGQLPAHCIVAGTGNGRLWKFHRRQIDDWLQHR